MGLFSWTERHMAPLSAELGTRLLARRMDAPCTVPDACVGVIASDAGEVRRIAAGQKLACAQRERAWLFHPGPYAVELLPFLSAPELGLRLAFAIDAPDPRVVQQRFDLFLAAEAPEVLALDAFSAQVEGALQRELAQGNLDLPPCTTLEEWHRFRAGLNQLLYTRFGITVDDCVPADLGERIDYAALLRQRRDAAAVAPLPAIVAVPSLEVLQQDDGRALRRLFLELPAVSCALRLAVLPPGPELFRMQQALLLRLDQANLQVNTMPALELAAPHQQLEASEQRRRVRASAVAVAALDDLWALLASLRAGTGIAAGFDEADRIVANLELALADRWRTHEGEDA